MDIKSLRYFIAVAEFGSITRAAACLHVAQPALSRQIRKLERDLGVELLQRTPRGVSLTHAGERLLERAGGIVRQIDRTRAEARSWEDDPAGPVSVALMPAVGPLIAPDMVRRVRTRFPDVRLTLVEGLTSFISQGLLNDEFDLGLLHAEGDDAAFAVTPLLREPMFLIGPGGRAGGAKAADDNPVSLDDLATLPLLLPSRPNALRLMVDRLASAHHVTLDIRESVDGTAIIKRLVEAGLGFTVQCYSYVHEEVSRGSLSARRMDVPGLSRDWCLARMRDRAPAAAATAVSKVIEEIAAELARARNWRTPSTRGSGAP